MTITAVATESILLKDTGCSLNIVFFSEFLTIFFWPFSVFPRCQSVYIQQAGRKPAPQQNWQSSEKSQIFNEKTQYLMNTPYVHSLSSRNVFTILIKTLYDEIK